MKSAGRPTAPADGFVRYPGSAVVVALLADKWTIPVIHALGHGATRTGELRRQIAGVSQKMLTKTLRMLEQRGLVERTVFPVVPPRVEYSLTPLGRSINRPLRQLCEWTREHGRALEEATRAGSRREA